MFRLWPLAFTCSGCSVMFMFFFLLAKIKIPAQNISIYSMESQKFGTCPYLLMQTTPDSRNTNNGNLLSKSLGRPIFFINSFHQHFALFPWYPTFTINTFFNEIAIMKVLLVVIGFNSLTIIKLIWTVCYSCVFPISVFTLFGSETNPVFDFCTLYESYF